jgi:hypothetical protein
MARQSYDILGRPGIKYDIFPARCEFENGNGTLVSFTPID